MAEDIMESYNERLKRLEEKVDKLMELLSLDTELLDLPKTEEVNSNSNETDVTDDITKILKELGIPTNMNGYNYLGTAIHMCVTGKASCNHKQMSKLYEVVANLHKTTKTGIERAISNAIKSAWESGNKEAQERLFGKLIDSTRKRPVNSLFISIVVEHIMNP